MIKNIKKGIGIICLTLIIFFNLFTTNTYASNIYDQDMIKSVQSILNLWGYNCGTPDGILGKNTIEAITSYQKDQEMSETGEISQELIDTMLLGVPLSTLNQRYNEAVEYWNDSKDYVGISTLNYSDFSNDETIYCLNDNMKIFIATSSDNKMTKMANICSEATFDVSTSLIEIYSLVYAFDVNIKNPADVQDLVGNILDETSYEDGGVYFTNVSVKGVGLNIWMKYDTD